MNIVHALAAAALLALAATGPAIAHEFKVGDLTIAHPHARATPPGAPVAGGYMTIRNNGASSDRLIGVKAGFAGRSEVHQMKMDGDVMKMRPVSGGFEIPPGGEVMLQPGGHHVMFMQLDGQLKAGETRKVTLEFEKAGEVEVEFAVEDMKPGGGRSGHDGHGSGKH